ncbi:MAG: circadian clock protein KaiC [Dehalogenimonas sp.]
MTKEPQINNSQPKALGKIPIGIKGFDDITDGGLPRGRTTLVCGNAGSGKTVFAMEFLTNGIIKYNEPGLFISFEESEQDLSENFASLGIDTKKMIADKKLIIDRVIIERENLTETGEYNLDALFIRIACAIDAIGAKRVVLDTIEAIFSEMPNETFLRSEIRRLFNWLKAKQVTSIVTGEKGTGTFTRYGLEEYVSDCVIVLDNRIETEISTRRLFIAKYRGSRHGSGEYPFLIDEHGISVIPLSSAGLDYKISEDRVSSGIISLDAMFGGKGFFKSSSILFSGTAGTGKTTFASYFVDAACRRGEKCLYLGYEESGPQVERNMRSVGLELQPWVESGLLRFHASRPSLSNLEHHLVMMIKHIDEVSPSMVVIDPVTSFITESNELYVKALLVRLTDHLKSRGITAVYTHLTKGGENAEQTEMGFSSMVDTWVVLSDHIQNSKRKHSLSILKSRGMNHSSEVATYALTEHGPDIIRQENHND